MLFFPVLLRYKFKMYSIMTYIHYEMIITISLVNIHHLIKIQKKKKERKMFFSCDENSKDLLSTTLPYIMCACKVTSVVCDSVQPFGL